MCCAVGGVWWWWVGVWVAGDGWQVAGGRCGVVGSWWRWIVVVAPPLPCAVQYSL